jgi:hypothetical protein
LQGMYGKPGFNLRSGSQRGKAFDEVARKRAIPRQKIREAVSAAKGYFRIFATHCTYNRRLRIPDEMVGA